MSTQDLSTGGSAPRVRPAVRELSSRHYLGFLVRSVLISVVIGVLAFGSRVFSASGWAGGFRLHTPRWELLLSASPAIQAHLTTVVLAAAIGLFLILDRKGTRLHRQLGYIYMAAMFATGLVTLTIPRLPFGPHLGPFGPLHLFSLLALVSVPAALWAARTGRWMLHGRLMGGLFVGGIGIAGLGAFTPGRLLWRVFFG